MARKKVPELKLEIVEGTGNLHFVSLIEYKREQFIGIIDNVTDTEISAYILDYAEQEKIDLPTFISVATRWFYAESEDKQFSIFLAKNGLTGWAAPMFRSLDVTFVSRIVGESFSYNKKKPVKVKRRRVSLPAESVTLDFRKKS